MATLEKSIRLFQYGANKNRAATQMCNCPILRIEQGVALFFVTSTADALADIQLIVSTISFITVVMMIWAAAIIAEAMVALVFGSVG
ncbi:MAG: hypothetical protein AAB445_00790 [Patescibacteria group bacterium]